MAADIERLLRILHYRDITVRLSKGRLIARAVHGHPDALICINGSWYRTPPESGPLPDDMRVFIAHFRDQLIAYLLEEERLVKTSLGDNRSGISSSTSSEVIDTTKEKKSPDAEALTERCLRASGLYHDMEEES